MDSISQEQMAVVAVAETGDESVSESGFPFPYWTTARRKFSPEASFFASGCIERELIAKQVALDLTEDERYHLENMEDGEGGSVFCPIAGCGARLNSLEDFEDHYHARHTASCSVCSRVYPTSRLLSIHISEAHDSFFQAKVARGIPMYECLVEGCGMKLKSYKSRQQHLLDKHKFPASFEFLKKAHSSKKQRQKHQRRQGKLTDQKRDDKMEVEETMDGLVSAVSKLSTSDSSPSSFSFGRRNTRGFTFIPRSVQRERFDCGSVERVRKGQRSFGEEVPQTGSQRVYEGRLPYGCRLCRDGIRRLLCEAHLHPDQQHHRWIWLRSHKCNVPRVMEADKLSKTCKRREITLHHLRSFFFFFDG
ncbi:hypothetical protein NE237_021341 [Protea cynaroides]|uniref:C2H2-type domain-containing protein n=1 Tax=Protea cynaroides TaxID=273540 RepID=A0A9Q0H7N9_9MAGN|nr:hypothetical protein NE237_021341 [Protea cynaroides]